ncbi:hypothetical protein AC579_2612 [Pseudocercospora musae]|uniref:Uncharacterized protein n=1 Tax=Pseudocercospora musae TaxID=113226 RepID=A0A139HV38_9PEZI|nr:hypothetical protein AC579_2612 [Pseudocercospora musae]
MSNSAPVFGPKWLSKLQDHFSTGDFRSLDAVKHLAFLHKAVDLTVTFTAEAIALGLKESDFQRDPLSVSMTALPRDLTDVKFTNPFFAVLNLEAAVEGMLKIWRTSQRAFANAALFYRTAMDRLGDKVDRAHRDGHWLAQINGSRISAQYVVDEAVQCASRNLNESRPRG